MSKSLGNVLLAKDIVKQYGGMPFRLMLLNAHYRAPVSFSDDTIQEAMKNANKLQSVYKQLAVELQMAGVDLSALKATNEDKFFEAMCEDLNTPNALAVVYEEAKLANQDLRVRPLPLEKLGEHFAALRDYFFTLGLTFAYPTLLEDDKRLMSEYLALKKEKKFEESDVLRKKLIEKGIL
jgi:cysteinyl-tRNA synthetase